MTMPAPGNLAHLHDIRGIDPVGLWPPAPGWWLVAGVVLLLPLLWLGLRGLRRWRVQRPERRWRGDAARRLSDLRRRVGRGEAHILATEFSELLRRIAIARCGRESCAGLAGQSWLDWLQANDPHGFRWGARGRPLLELPYAPTGASRGDELAPLVDAAMAWTRHGTADGGGHGV